jgi:hypothetical protein
MKINRINLIKFFAVAMIAVFAFLTIIRLTLVFAWYEFHQLLNLPIDVFMLSMSTIIFRGCKGKPLSEKTLKIIWPSLIFLGIIGLLYFYNGYKNFKLAEEFYSYKVNPIFLYHPAGYALLLIIYGLLIKYLVNKIQAAN